MILSILPLDRFWVRQDPVWCTGDTCWRDLLYIFHLSDDGEFVSYVTMCSLALTFLATVALCLTRRYW